MTFLEVVEANGFSAAARRTGMPRSTVSLHVQRLEEELGIRLLKRSTRSVSLTEDGQRLVETASGPIEDLFEALHEVRSEPGVLKGLIRITMPSDLPTPAVASAITSFSRNHPEVRFETIQTNRTLNLVEENIDIAIGIGAGRSQDAVERHVGDIAWSFVAAPSWLKEHQHEDLLDLEWLVSPAAPLREFLEMHVLGGKKLPPPSIVVDDHRMAFDLVIEGFGAALLPTDLCRQAVEEGNLEFFLQDTVVAMTPFKLVFPTRSDITERVRAFAEHLATEFRQPVVR